MATVSVIGWSRRLCKNKEFYPPERTLLATGAIEAIMDSSFMAGEKEKRRIWTCDTGRNGSPCSCEARCLPTIVCEYSGS